MLFSIAVDGTLLVRTGDSKLPLTCRAETQFFIWPYSCLGSASFPIPVATSPIYGSDTKLLSAAGCVFTSPTSPFSTGQPRTRAKTQGSRPAGQKATTQSMQTSLLMRAMTVKSVQQSLSITRILRLCSTFCRMPCEIPTLQEDN